MSAAGEPAVPPGGPGFLRPLEWLVIGNSVVYGLVLLAAAARGFSGCLAQAAWSFGVGAGACLVGWATRRTTHRGLLLVRLGWAPVMYFIFYHQAGIIWPTIYRAPFDGWLASADQALFGTQPALRFQDLLPSRLLSEIFCYAYFTYFLYTPLVGVPAFFKSFAAAERVVFATTLGYYLCYTIFWLFPTVAPHYWFPPHAGPQPYNGYVFNHLLFFLTSHGEIRGGAFPSSHIAVATLLTVYARRETPRLFPFLAVTTALLYPAVVYLHAHYVVDVPAGIAVGLFVAAISDRLQARFGGG
ncbi:MAG TPA: phosphatase PAP2 family protein [Thermoanaerobaculia bacterium]|nr:phosphatase PAP2 family protein [Thermoanaerobaculia bacterium]